MNTARVVVMTKDPVPGRVKTRLVPALGAQGAAALHHALVMHTLDVARASGLPVVVALAGDLDGTFAQDLRAAGAAVVAQGLGDLGERLSAALCRPGRHVCIGTDCPGLQPEDLKQAAAELGHVVLGPALDGGYWLIALDGRPTTGDPTQLFEGISWSTSVVLEQTLGRARGQGFSTRLLATRRDLDTPSDLAAWTADPTFPAALRHAVSSAPPPAR